MKSMMGTITESNKMLNTIKLYMTMNYPDFTKDNTLIKYGEHSGIKEYFSKDTNEYFCTYWSDDKDLGLNSKIFNSLYSMFGEDGMTYILDWFNKEFDEDAENASFVLVR